MASSGDSALRSQFQLLQQQQQKKLELQKQQTEAKNKNRENMDEANTLVKPISAQDDLDLKVASDMIKFVATPSSTQEQLLFAEQNRELRDETGRLQKLLSERNLELKQLRRKRDEERAVAAATGGMATSDAVATKIVELSKRVRELSAELEAERTKAKALARKMSEAEAIQLMTADNRKSIAFSSDPDDRVCWEQTIFADELKSTQEKLRQSEAKCAELRNQTQTLKNELKLAQKVLSQEVGEGVKAQTLLNASGGWRGRSQQIVALQRKVSELKKQLEQLQKQDGTDELSALEEEMLFGGISMEGGAAPGGAGAGGKLMSAEEKNREKIRKLEKVRKEGSEKVALDLKNLEQEHESLKQKLEATKSRNKVLSGDVKTLKQQLQTLLDKGRHDDELITALFKQQTQLKQSLSEVGATVGETRENFLSASQKTANMREQQAGNEITQLRAILADKEVAARSSSVRIQALEVELRSLKSAMNSGRSESNSNNCTMAADLASSPHAFSRSSSTLSEVSEKMIAEIVGKVLSPKSSSRSVGGRRPGPPGTEEAEGGTVRHAFVLSQGGSVNFSAVSSDEDNSSLKLHELNCLYQAATLERNRFAELVQVLEKRLEQSTLKLVQAQSDQQAQKRQNALLEKQLGRVKAEQLTSAGGGAKRSMKKGGVSEGVDGRGATEDIEPLQLRLEMQQNDNEALKAALQSTLRAKEEDLRLYTDMIEETKRLFLQGIRQYRSSTT